MIFRPIQIEEKTPNTMMDIQHARMAEVARVRLVHQEWIEEEELATLQA
jgi:hypothetical protein